MFPIVLFKYWTYYKFFIKQVKENLKYLQNVNSKLYTSLTKITLKS